MSARPPATLIAGAPSGNATPPIGNARIGPNAIIQVTAAARELVGESDTRRLFAAAALLPYLEATPQGMVDEADVARLHRRVRQTFPPELAERLLRHAGILTGDYVLAHRIPQTIRRILPWLPDRSAARLLLGAIERHAWTFAGSGRFEAQCGRPVRLAIAGNPLCRELSADLPACHYYAATFQRLFRALVNARIEVVETACEACGAPACRFEASW